MLGRGLKLGALGGPFTFNGQAARAMRARYPEFGEIVHYPTSEEAVAAALRAVVDATCAPEQSSRTGFHPGMLARLTAPGSGLHVVAQVTRTYHCSLLGKPGASLAGVRLVQGHDGSVNHSRPWLEANLPQARIEIVKTHSLAAARAVLDSDGSVASVGSRELIAEHGLAELARDIDEGSRVSYWAVSLRPVPDPRPTRLVVTARLGEDGGLGRLIADLSRAGFETWAAHARPSGLTLGEQDYLLKLSGSGDLDAVRARIAQHATARLAGAWVPREEDASVRG